MGRTPLSSPSAPQIAPRLVQTVLGEITYQSLGITDAHNHVWIDAIAGADLGAPVLNQYEKIRQELSDYTSTGGGSLLDCQPSGCGRDANMLVQLARESGVNIIACTGFHRKRYYPQDYELFAWKAEQVAEFFIKELTVSLRECEGAHRPARAGFIKIALEKTWAESPQAALEGTAIAARETGALVEIHTEKGALAEKAVMYFEERGIAPQRLVLCHMDKRPDHALQMALASYGPLLEYDTFYRPKYDPESKLWPLICKMAEAGLSERVVLATDMAEAEMYHSIGNGPGLASLPGDIKTRLEKLGIPGKSIQQMLGGNIARRLAGINA